MSLVILGEAATRLKREDQKALAELPELPLQQRVGLRNRIAHGYYALDFQIIWQTVITDVAELRRRLELIYEAAGERLGGAPQAPTTD